MSLKWSLGHSIPYYPITAPPECRLVAWTYAYRFSVGNANFLIQTLLGGLCVLGHSTPYRAIRCELTEKMIETCIADTFPHAGSILARHFLCPWIANTSIIARIYARVSVSSLSNMFQSGIEQLHPDQVGFGAAG